VVGSFTAPEGPGPFPGVVALSGSGGGVPGWWGDLLAPHGTAVLAAAYFGVEPLPSTLCEIPVETVASAGEWLRGRPEIREGPVGLVGGSKGAELALLSASTYAGLTERGLRSVGIYAAALEQADAVAAAAIPVERAAGPLLLLSGGDGACPSTLMARMIVERMEAHDRAADVRHLDFPECGHVIVRPWPPGQAPPMPFDNGGTEEALDAAHEVALPAVVGHLCEEAQ
jgi:dienelactone hydrolase